LAEHVLALLLDFILEELRVPVQAHRHRWSAWQEVDPVVMAPWWWQTTGHLKNVVVRLQQLLQHRTGVRNGVGGHTLVVHAGRVMRTAVVPEEHC